MKKKKERLQDTILESGFFQNVKSNWFATKNSYTILVVCQVDSFANIAVVELFEII